MVYGIDVLTYISPMAVAYGSSKFASYSKEMPESLYVAEVSPVHKITFSAEFSSLQLNLPLAHMNRRDF